MKALFRGAFALAMVLFVSGLLFAPGAARAVGSEILVFAAASTTDALTDIGALYQEKGLGSVKASFASSSTLAKQIEQGAPADVFLSANLSWMEYLEARNMIAEGSRTDLLRNQIVLIVPRASAAGPVTIGPESDLLELLGSEGRLAIGDPEHVPVGQYGKEALQNLGLWTAVKDRIAPMKDVRAGLALVERGEAPLGIVYESDVAASDKVRIIGVFPQGSHTEVVYPVGAIAGNSEDAGKAFIEFLKTPEALAIFKKYGFAGM